MMERTDSYQLSSDLLVHVLVARELTQWLRVLAALAEGPSLVPSTHIGWLATSYKSSLRGYDTFSLQGHLYSYIPIHRHIIQYNF